MPGYVYAVHNSEVYVNLFMSNNSTLKVAGKNVSLQQKTTYPWNGDIRINVNPSGKQQFKLKIRIPGWVRSEVLPSDLYTYNTEIQLEADT